MRIPSTLDRRFFDIKSTWFLIVCSLVFASCTGPSQPAENVENDPDAEVAVTVDPDATVEVLPVAKVEWEQLNPARGDKSPQAATLWGNRRGPGPTGFLVKFLDGFSSPPHIHNVSYRGVVISGQVHNDDPDAAPMWMPPGSFWTQPAGEAHITSAKGEENIAFIEIEDGPYLVKPTEEAFDNGERPVNLDRSNMVWVKHGTDGPAFEKSHLWGSPEEGELHGTLVRVPKGANGVIRSKGSTFRAVVIQGRLRYEINEGPEPQALDPGSVFSSSGSATHEFMSAGIVDAILYIRSLGKYNIELAKP